jgi:hypothetical protein
MPLTNHTASAEILRFTEPTTRLLLDSLTFGHLAAMSAALGAVIFADTTILRRIGRPTTPQQLAVIHHAHGVISIALALLWVTGIALLGLKTSFDPANFTPKLMAKLATVTLLTMTALTMARVAVPYLTEHVGQCLLNAPLADRCTLAFCAGMSAGGWSTALMLGSSKILKTAGDEVVMLSLATHGLAVGGALALALTAFLLWREEAGGAVPA